MSAKSFSDDQLGRPSAPLLLTNHQGIDILSPEECRQLLADNEIGRIGFNQRGQTVILPVNYAFVSGAVLFRTAPGSKLDIGMRGGPASFEIDGWDTATQTGWSVLVKGRADEVTDEWLIAICEHVGVEPWADRFPRKDWVRISVEELTGRWIFRPELAMERPGSGS